MARVSITRRFKLTEILVLFVTRRLSTIVKLTSDSVMFFLFFCFCFCFCFCFFLGGREYPPALRLELKFEMLSL